VPTSYAVERVVAAPPVTVFALLADSATYADWNRAVLSIDGPIAAGGTVRLVSVANPERTFALRVTELEPPTRMVWASGMPLGLFRGVRTFTLAPEGDGGTRFSMREVYTGPLAPLVTRAIPDLTESFALFADGLKEAAEARAR
jgi:uncharacterized protein YndB with AHSA1/START domain